MVETRWCTYIVNISDIMLAKSSEGRVKESEVLKIIKSSLNVESGQNISVREKQEDGYF